MLEIQYKNSPKVEATIDFGNGQKRGKIADENGKVKKFASHMEVVNYVIEQGWKYETLNTVLTNSATFFIVVLKKEVSDAKEIMGDIKVTEE